MAYIQECFRIRRTDDQGLNASFDAGDPAENINATIDAGTFFRVRFKVRETAGASNTNGFKLQYSKNSGGWADVGTWNTQFVTPVQIFTSTQYTDGDATTAELLTSTTANVNGEGFEDNTSASYTLTSEETEFEFCLMLHRSYARVQVNVNGGASPTWDLAASSVVDNTHDIDVGPATGSWGTIVAAALIDASSAGNLLVYDNSVADQAVGDGDTVTFTAGDFDISLS